MTIRSQLPYAPIWSPEFQKRLNDALEERFRVLNEHALVPYGGTQGQILTKTSDRPYVMEWADSCCGSDTGTPQPGSEYVGGKQLTCGTTLPYTPASDTPSAAAGDLAVLIVQPRAGLLTDNDDAYAKPPTGWLTFSPSANGAGDVAHAELMPAIFYKFLEAADLNTTHTVTETNASIDYLCGIALVYRNVNTKRPFGALATMYEPHGSASTGNPIPIYSTAQHVICIWNRVLGPGFEAGNLFPYDSDPADWPLYDQNSMEGFVEYKFGVSGQGGDSRARQNSVATWKASILNDENLIPYENEAQSITGGTWTPVLTTIEPRTAGDWYTVLTPGGTTAEHYVEFQQAFNAGEKLTFAPFVYAISSASHGYWVSVIDPDNNERGQLIYHNSGNPGWILGVRADTAGDYGTTWRVIERKNEPDGVPEVPLGGTGIVMTAPTTGTYKFRIFLHNSATNSLAARTTAGTTNGRIGVRHVLLRHGHVTPYIVPTGATPVIGSGASFSTPTRGWAAGLVGRHLAFTLNPAFENNGTPYASMRSISDNEGDVEYDPVIDGNTIWRRTGSTTDSSTIACADQMIYPYVDGALAKYYFEIEVLTPATGSSIEFFGLNCPAVIPQNSNTTNNRPTYGVYHYPSYAGVGNYTFWTDAVGSAGPDTITWAANDVWGCEVNFAAGNVKWYQNGVLKRTTSITNQFPDTGGPNFYAIQSGRFPMRLIVGCGFSNGKYRVRLRPDWLYGPSSNDFLPYDFTGDANITTWVQTIPAPGNGAEIIYQDPGTGKTLQRALVGTDGVAVTQATDTIEVGLDVSGLTTQTLDRANDFIAFYDASTRTHSKTAASNLGTPSPTTTAGDIIRRGATADERLAIGAEGDVLTVTSGMPVWAAPTGGSGGGGGSSSSPVDDGARVTYAGTAQSITSGTAADVTFDTEQRDDGAYWSAASPTRFTITQSGWYVIGGSVYWASNATGGRYLWIYKNGTDRLAQTSDDTDGLGASNQAQSVSTVAYLSAGDYVTLRANQDSGGALTLAVATGHPNFWIHRLAVAASPANPANDGVMVYRGASPQTLTTGTHTSVTFDTEERDEGAYATLGTNNDRLTVANAGWYLVQGTCGFSASIGGNRSVYLMVNGDTTGRHFQQTLGNAGASLNTVINVAGVLYLNAGDYVQLRAYQDSGGDLTIPVNTAQKNPRLSLHRLGTATPTPAQRYERMWDFDTMYTVPSDPATAAEEWSRNQSGSAGVSIVDSEADHPGIVQLSSGTTAGGVGSIQQSLSGATVRRTYFLDSVPLVIETLVKASAVPTATEDFGITFGLRSSTAYTDRAQGGLAWNGTSAVYRVTTGASSVNTVGTGGGTPSTAWTHLRLVATTSSVRLYVNGALVDTVTTNIPTVGMHLFILIVKNAGSVSQTAKFDFLRVYKDFSTRRYTG